MRSGSFRLHCFGTNCSAYRLRQLRVKPGILTPHQPHRVTSAGFTHSKWFCTCSKQKSLNRESVQFSHIKTNFIDQCNDARFSMCLYSIGTHHRNLLNSLVTMRRVTYFFSPGPTQETASAKINTVKKQWENLEKKWRWMEQEGRN